MLASPLEAAQWRAPCPYYNKDTQTDSQTQVSDTGTHRQTAHAKDLHPPRAPYVKKIGTYECMYVCTYYKYMYVNMNGKLTVYK